MKKQWIFKGKVKDNNPMTNPSSGWVTGILLSGSLSGRDKAFHPKW